MNVVRAAAKHGYVLPERGYPLRTTPGSGAVETAYVLGITRQESGFDPHVRSPAGATGMMQLMPTTARTVAKNLQIAYSQQRLLTDADYNMTLGCAYLNDMLDRFGGSYVLAVAAYNAGPARVNNVVVPEALMASATTLTWPGVLPSQYTASG